LASDDLALKAPLSASLAVCGVLYSVLLGQALNLPFGSRVRIALV
jgi:hypothetical protein